MSVCWYTFAFMFFAVIISSEAINEQDSNAVENMGTVVDQIRPITDALWEGSTHGKDFIVSSYLSDYFARYMAVKRDFLSLTSYRFINGGATSWVQDFSFLGMTSKQARAYFYLLDVFKASVLQMLTISDMDALINIADEHTGNTGDGILTEEKFKRGFNEVILRGAPFAVLFVNTSLWHGGNMTTFMHVFWDGFRNLFNRIDKNNDECISRKEFGTFWYHEKYGPASQGAALFRRLDYETKGVLNMTDWRVLFAELDCRKIGKDQLIFEEFLQLDLILHGLLDYPLQGQCVLRRDTST